MDKLDARLGPISGVGHIFEVCEDHVSIEHCAAGVVDSDRTIFKGWSKTIWGVYLGYWHEMTAAIGHSVIETGSDVVEDVVRTDGKPAILLEN